jgi:hypothetical protein
VSAEARWLKMKRTLAIALMLAMPLLLIFAVALHTHYADTRPQQPQPSTGQVYPLNVHGTMVYLTWGEDMAAAWVFVGGVLCGVLGGALWRSVERHKK